MATADLPPVLEPIQVDFSRIVGMTTESTDDRDACSSLDVELPVQTNEWVEARASPGGGSTEDPTVASRGGGSTEELPVGSRGAGSTEELPVGSRGTRSTEESPLPRQSGLTFDEMVERALAEGAGSPFGVQQLSGHVDRRQLRPPPQTSGIVDSPLGLVDESGATSLRQARVCTDTPRRCDEDEEMQEFIGLEERLRRGDELTEEEQLLCRTPSTLPAGDAVAAGIPVEVGNEARPADVRLNAALAWAGLGADRDHDTGTECVARPPARSRLPSRFAY